MCLQKQRFDARLQFVWRAVGDQKLSCSPEQLFLMSHFIYDIVSEVYLFGCLFLVITQGYNISGEQSEIRSVL